MTTARQQRINWSLVISVIALLGGGAIGLVRVGRMFEAKADKVEVEALKQTTVALSVQTQTTSHDVERILAAIERLENKIDRAQARTGGR